MSGQSAMYILGVWSSQEDVGRYEPDHTIWLPVTGVSSGATDDVLRLFDEGARLINEELRMDLLEVLEHFATGKFKARLIRFLDRRDGCFMKPHDLDLDYLDVELDAGVQEVCSDTGESVVVHELPEWYTDSERMIAAFGSSN